MMPSFVRGSAIAAALAGGVLFLGARGRVAVESASDTLPAPAIDMPLAPASRDETVVFAGGCFWGIQAVFEHVRGVKSAVSGYAGGTTVSPSYEDVSSGATGHAESVQVVFDASQVSLGTLLEIFFSVAHDPTQSNRQGPDVGTQYRSAVFYLTDEQRRVTEAYITQLTDAKTFSRPIVTQVSPLRAFYPAEAYHQHYAMLHPDSPYIATYDLPKVAALKERYPALYRDDVSVK
jgi:peptide-methionine (S)-S-oxide reductase